MTSRRSVLRRAAAGARPALLAAAGFSLVTNLLAFASPVYMLQVYDRVLASRSEETLIAVSGLALGAFGLAGAIEVLRARILVRAGIAFDRVLAAPLFDAVLGSEIRGGRGGSGQALRDMDTVREFLMGAAPAVLCDAPWAPLFLVLAFLIHPAIGWLSLTGMVLLLAMTLLAEAATRRTLRSAGQAAAEAAGVSAAALRGAEAVRANGMSGAMAARWLARHEASLALQARASDRAGLLVALTRTVRIALQSAVLGLGAYLVIEQQMAAGAMFAATLMLGRAIAPVEQAVQHWKGFVTAREAWRRIGALLDAVPEATRPMPLPAPSGAVSIEGLAVVPPGADRATLSGVSLTIAAGEVIGIVGPSASGKSTLLRALVGVWQPARGAVRLDGASLDGYEADALGRSLGYLPQDVELFAGTVAENIARFGAVDTEAVVSAARAAGVHDMILRLPQGYDTRLGAGGTSLSGGQRQRIGLARALYGMPALIVLDEPNASLDAAGEEALAAAIRAAAAVGSTVVLSSHKPSLLAVADRIAVIADGTLKMAGPRDAVIARLAPKSPVRAVA